MKRMIIGAAVMAAMTVAIADEAVRPKVRPVSPEFKNRREEIMMTKHGGLIRKTGTGEGRIAFFDSCPGVAGGAVRGIAQRLCRDIRVDFEIVTNQAFSLAGAADAVKAAKAGVGVFFVSSKDLPDLLVAADSRWALVNAGGIGGDAANRLAKLTIRALAQVCGAGLQTVRGSVLGPIDSAADLDGVKMAVFPGDIQMRMQAYLREIGVKTYKLNTYKNACEEGWAPKPANKWQEAIWKEVHQRPTQGIEIKYDPKKGE